jgi:peptidoglycan/LPS O-acetylase OafA/YrhL
MALVVEAELPSALAGKGFGPSTRLAYVDVLRAVAIFTVLFHHLPEGFGLVFGRLQEWGGRGVDLFFVLSGFLIGSTCLERAATGANRWKQMKGYWLLRTARIWPLYFLLLAVYAVGLPIIDPLASRILREHPFPYVFFTSNYFQQATLELGVLWSLAIEEQFYLAVGLLILLCSQRKDTLGTAFIGIALCAVTAAARYRYEIQVLYLSHSLDGPGYIPKLFFGTLSRMDQLALGLAAAVFAPRFNRSSLANLGGYPRVATWAGVGVCLACLVYLPHRPVFGFTLLGLCFSASVLWAQRPAAQSIKASGLEPRAVRLVGYVGRLSYGLYLVHPVTRYWMLKGYAHWGMPLDRHTAVAFIGVWFIVTLVIAAISYRFLEAPLLARAQRTVRRILEVKPT